jgi:AP-1 complex subunit beta-1
MGCLRVSKIIDYIAEPLRKLLDDESPYVRKTAAICVAKLFDIEPEVALENGFVAKLGEMLSDRNPTVRCFIAAPVPVLSNVSKGKYAK